MDNVQKWVGNGQGMSGEWVGNGQGIWREWRGVSDECTGNDRRLKMTRLDY